QGQGLYEFTADVIEWTARKKLTIGLLTVFCSHTSASLILQENADPDVSLDLQSFFERLVGDGPSLYRHSQEGPDDMPAHIRAALTDVSLTIPVRDGKPTLGTWQGIFLFEHRTAPHQRRIILHLSGD
ncbi:MAG TPA: YjbQ family protein, partial [Rhodospirillales bacterium]|nr:YjbQ family protein [Rhodospirillales bacterium]